MAHDADDVVSRLFPETLGGALVGSHPKLRRRQPNGEPDPPTPVVSAPDVALQTAPCLDALSSLFSIDLADQVVAALGRFGDDVRRRCGPVAGISGDVETLGVWARSTSDAEVSQARERGLRQLRVLEGGQHVAFLFTRPFLRRVIQQAFDDLPTRRFDAEGRPNSDGSVHLTGISLDLEPPDKIKTVISGFDDRPFPDVDFQMTVTDRLTIRDGALSCDTTREVDTETGLLTVLSAVSVFFVIELLAVLLKAGAPPSSPVDCWVQALAPNEIPIVGGRKVVLFYEPVQQLISRTGLVVATRFFPELAERRPSAEVIGRRRLVDSIGTGVVRATYRVELDDLRDPVQVQWFLGSRLVAEGEGLVSRRIMFPTTPGKTEVKQLRVRAEDGDDLTAEDEISVTVEGRRPRGPLP